jgi:hypothetical protein
MKSRFRMLLAAITFFAGVALLFAALALPLRLAAQNNRGQVVDRSDIGRHYGNCEVSDIRGYYELTGLCVSHLPYPPYFCDIQPANPATCGAAFPPTQVRLTTCGGIGSDQVDLARPCSFP